MEKRKRSEVEASRSIPHHLPSDSINPFSRSPGQLLQFSFVGLGETDDDPSERIPFFPHQGLDYGVSHQIESESEGDTEGEQARQKKDTDKNPSQKEQRFMHLLQATQQFIDQGQIARAARAYGLLLQMQPRGYPTDVRYYNLWAIGAEILMREGEEHPRLGATAPGKKHRRWGSTANIDKVRAYFESLIQQHPYDPKRPRAICAVDFWLALFSCEMYDAYMEHMMATDDAEDGADESEEEMEDSRGWDMGSPANPVVDDTLEPANSLLSGREGRIVQRREAIRVQTLARMRGVAEKMDRLISERPYSKQVQFLRLRAMVSLYISDLLDPVVPSTSHLSTRRAEDERESERAAARKYLARLRDAGVELDPFAKSMLGEDDGSEAIQRPLFSSLPLRIG